MMGYALCLVYKFPQISMDFDLLDFKCCKSTVKYTQVGIFLIKILLHIVRNNYSETYRLSCLKKVDSFDHALANCPSQRNAAGMFWVLMQSSRKPWHSHY